MVVSWPFSGKTNPLVITSVITLQTVSRQDFLPTLENGTWSCAPRGTKGGREKPITNIIGNEDTKGAERGDYELRKICHLTKKLYFANSTKIVYENAIIKILGIFLKGTKYFFRVESRFQANFAVLIVLGRT